MNEDKAEKAILEIAALVGKLDQIENEIRQIKIDLADIGNLVIRLRTEDKIKEVKKKNE